MDIKSVLCITRPEDGDETLTNALTFAQTSNSHLMVLVVGELMAPMVSAYDMVNSEIWVEQTNEARAKATARVDKIEAMLAGSDVSGTVVSAVAQNGNIPGIVARTARYSDLTMMFAPEDPDKRLRDAIISGVLFDSGSAVLISGAGQTATLTPSTAVIAWNATPEAGRAVREAMPILKAAGTVITLLIDPVPSFSGHGDEPGANIANYLSHHGISTVIERVPSEGRGVEEVIRRVVRDNAAELLVLGGYGHSRLRQRIIGGTTTSMLDAPPCPTLLAH